MSKQKVSLLNNSRFYILVTSFLLSIVVVSYLRLQVSSDQLFYIRAEQVFGFMCIFYWYFALIISPIGHVIGKQRIKKLEFARRGIGVSAFYFALLHATVALWGQLGGIGQIQYLPPLFKWSLLGGVIALGILFLMAITSLDKAVSFMTFRWWKWLHRLVYFGGILAIFHIWSIGTHLAYTKIQIVAFIALVILSGLEVFKITKLINKRYFHLGRAEAVTLFASIWIVIIVLILLIPFFIKNYHSNHIDHIAMYTSQYIGRL